MRQTDRTQPQSPPHKGREVREDMQAHFKWQTYWHLRVRNMWEDFYTAPEKKQTTFMCDLRGLKHEMATTVSNDGWYGNRTTYTRRSYCKNCTYPG